jgi:hypothetical protein
VDLSDVQAAAAVAIDDPRYFGNIAPDQEFPELEDIAFSQNMLSDYASLRAARGRTIASQHDTTQKEEIDFRGIGDLNRSRKDTSMQSSTSQSPAVHHSQELVDIGYIPGEETWDPTENSRTKSRFSDVELARGEKTRASMSTLARSSFSSTGISAAMRFDDDIPAFDEHIDDAIFGNDEAPQLEFQDDFGPGFDADMTAVHPIRDEHSPMFVEESKADGIVQAGDAELSGGEKGSHGAKHKVLGSNKAKRQRVTVCIKTPFNDLVNNSFFLFIIYSFIHSFIHLFTFSRSTLSPLLFTIREGRQ